MNQHLSQQMAEAARTILSVLAPKLSRVARVAVQFKNDAVTASTDGNIRVIMPRDFLGSPIPEDAPVTLGLLAHEMGHWVQPLKRVVEIAVTRGAPFWLVNIAMDIHGESFVENVFPAMKIPLQKTRATVRRRLLTQYRQDLADAVVRDDVQGMALNASLIARATMEHPWILPSDYPYPTDENEFLTELENVQIPAWLGHFIDEMFWHFYAGDVTPSQLPLSFKMLLDKFPQLLSEDESEGRNAGQNQSNASGTSEEDASEPENAGDEEESDTDKSTDTASDENADQENGKSDDVAGTTDTEQDVEDESNESGSESDQDKSGPKSEDDGKGNANSEPDTSLNTDEKSDDSSGDGGDTGSIIEDEDKEGDKLPVYAESEFDELGEMLREEMQQIAQDFHSTPPTIRVQELPTNLPLPEALRLARVLQPRFQSPHAKLEVTAPGRLNRLDLARGAPVPLRMDVKGHESPAIKLVLALDVSSSMFPGRILSAQIAAQAITLAVKNAGGEVVVVLFDHRAFISPNEDDSLAFSEPDAFKGGTSFLFLGEVWRRWPQHQVLLVTDGDSSHIPDPFPADRERTSVILIGDYSDVSAFAARSVYLDDLNRLASVLAILLPDRRL